MTALVIAEHDNAHVKGATLNTVTAALACGGDVHVLVAGSNAAGAAAAAAQIAGVTKVLHADAAQLADGLAENLAAQVIAVASSYSHILFPATASGKNVAPRVAALLDVAQLSDVTKVISADTFERPIYAGNAIATVQSADATKVLTVRTTGFDAAAATGGSCGVEAGRAHGQDLGRVGGLHGGDRVAGVDRPLEGVGADHLGHIAQLSHIQQGRHARRHVLARGGGREQDMAVARCHGDHLGGQVLSQAVGQLGGIGVQHLGDASDLCSGGSGAGGIRASHQNVDISTACQRSRDGVQGGALDVGVVVFSNYQSSHLRSPSLHSSACSPGSRHRAP